MQKRFCGYVCVCVVCMYVSMYVYKLINSFTILKLFPLVPLPESLPSPPSLLSDRVRPPLIIVPSWQIKCRVRGILSHWSLIKKPYWGTDSTVRDNSSSLATVVGRPTCKLRWCIFSGTLTQPVYAFWLVAQSLRAPRGSGQLTLCWLSCGVPILFRVFNHLKSSIRILNLYPMFSQWAWDICVCFSQLLDRDSQRPVMLGYCL